MAAPNTERVSWTLNTAAVALQDPARSAPSPPALGVIQLFRRQQLPHRGWRLTPYTALDTVGGRDLKDHCGRRSSPRPPRVDWLSSRCHSDSPLSGDPLRPECLFPGGSGSFGFAHKRTEWAHLQPDSSRFFADPRLGLWGRRSSFVRVRDKIPCACLGRCFGDGAER